MDRRSLLKSLAAAGAVALLPDADAFAAWTRVASGVRVANGLSDAQLARISTIADALLPRTDTPSATDVGVPAFVDVIVSENYTDADRAACVANLDAIDPTALDAIEAADRRAEPQRTYWRLKGLIVHGYFTSERVMKDVLHYEVMPGRFDGSAAMASVRHG
ncbi:MAG TPA: gluconate 2-dehydrogenase subunit 3 family protein [Gemmatimonadaceae bacterium]|jgi:hypothetical protein